MRSFTEGFSPRPRTVRRLAVMLVTVITILTAAGRIVEAQQTLYRNTLSASGNTLTNLSGWSTSSVASGGTPGSVTSADTLVFANYWTPGLLSGVNLWVDAADASTITTGTDSGLTVVTQWADKSGSGNTMTRGLSVGPAYQSGTSAAAINGLAVLTTSTLVDRFLNTSSAILSPTFDVYAVTRSPGGSSMAFAQAIVGAQNRTFLYQNDPSIPNRLGGIQVNTSSQIVTGTASNTLPHVFGWSKTASSGTVQMSMDGSTILAGPLTGTPQNVGFSIGGVSNLRSAATYAEAIVTGSSNLAAADRELVEGYLAWKWGQTTNLAASNPYKSAVPLAATNTVYLGGSQAAAGLVFSGSASATTLVGGTSGGAAANTMTIGSGGISVGATAGATTLGAASGGTVGLVLDASQSWTNDSAALLRAHNDISRASGDTTSRMLTIAGGGETRLDGVIADGGAAGSLGLTKTGAGRLLLDGANTFTGSTLITGGTLALGAGGNLASGAIDVGSGATFDLLAATFTLGNGRAIGGDGTILGNLVFGAGSKFAFTTGLLNQLTLTSGSASFVGTFGVADVLGLDGTTPEGTYTLLAGTVDFANVINVGPGAAVPIGEGKSAYFQNGSLQLVVVPEPGTAALAAAGMVVVGWTIRRRGNMSRCIAAD